MKLENTFLSEVTKACESKYCLFSLVCGFYICGILLWIEVRKSERDPERENKEAGQESDGTGVKMEGEDRGGRVQADWGGRGQDREERQLVTSPVTTKHKETCNSEH